jgi:hypothetical protein
MKSTPLFIITIILGACGGDDGGNVTPDAAEPPPMPDSAIDSPPVPAMITVAGTATERNLNGTAPVANATIEAFSNADDTTPVATATTDGQGNFSLSITTNGVPLDGFLKATKAGLKVSFLYPPTALVADTAMVPINMLTQGNFDTLSTLAGGDQAADKGMIALIVVDGPSPAAMPVAGATVKSTPDSMAYRYNGSNGFPSSSATSTQADGVAYMFNVPPDVAVTVQAEKTGVTFLSHALEARADAFTTTLITQ